MHFSTLVKRIESLEQTPLLVPLVSLVIGWIFVFDLFIYKWTTEPNLKTLKYHELISNFTKTANRSLYLINFSNGFPNMNYLRLKRQDSSLLWSYPDPLWFSRSAACSGKRTSLWSGLCSSPLCPEPIARPFPGRPIWGCLKSLWWWRCRQKSRNTARSRGKQSKLCRCEKHDAGYAHYFRFIQMGKPSHGKLKTIFGMSFLRISSTWK